MPGRSRLVAVLLATAAAVLLMSPAARADSVTFHDATDSMFVTQDSGSDNLVVNCHTVGADEDYCSAYFLRLGFFVTGAFSAAGDQIPQDNDYHTMGVDEPGGGPSDRLDTYASFSAAVVYFFPTWRASKVAALTAASIIADIRS